MDDELLLAVAELVEALEEERTSIEESDFIARLDRARKELELAKISVRCPLCQRELDKLLKSLEEKTELLKRAELARAIMEERAIRDSWWELDGQTKKEIKEEIKRRLRG